MSAVARSASSSCSRTIPGSASCPDSARSPTSNASSEAEIVGHRRQRLGSVGDFGDGRCLFFGRGGDGLGLGFRVLADLGGIVDHRDDALARSSLLVGGVVDRLDALVCGLDSLGDRVDRLDTVLDGLRAGGNPLAHAVDLVDGLVDRRLDTRDEGVDLLGCLAGLLGEGLDFVSDDGEAVTSPAAAASMEALSASKLV